MHWFTALSGPVFMFIMQIGGITPGLPEVGAIISTPPAKSCPADSFCARRLGQDEAYRLYGHVSAGTPLFPRVYCDATSTARADAKALVGGRLLASRRRTGAARVHHLNVLPSCARSSKPVRARIDVVNSRAKPRARSGELDMTMQRVLLRVAQLMPHVACVDSRGAWKCASSALMVVAGRREASPPANRMSSFPYSGK